MEVPKVVLIISTNIFIHKIQCIKTPVKLPPAPPNKNSHPKGGFFVCVDWNLNPKGAQICR